MKVMSLRHDDVLWRVSVYEEEINVEGVKRVFGVERSTLVHEMFGFSAFLTGLVPLAATKTL